MTRTADRTLLQTLGFDDPDRKNEEHDLACRFMVQPETMAKLAQVLNVHPSDAYFRPPYSDVVATSEHLGHVEVPIMRGQGYHIGFLDAAVTLCWHMAGMHDAGRAKTHEELIREVGTVPPMDDRRALPTPPWLSAGFGAGESHRWVQEARGLRGADVESTRRSEAVRKFNLLHAEISKERHAPIEAYRERIRIAGHERLPDPRPHESWTSPDRVGIEVKIGPTPIGSAIKQIKLYQQYWHARSWVLATRLAITAADREALRSEGIVHIRLAAGFDAYLETLKRSGESGSAEF